MKLSYPFPPDAIHWRVGSTTKDKSKGMALAYIDARDVMDRLDAVVGPENWSDEYEFHGARIICRLTVFGVSKCDGAGETDIESEKGGISDAFKRAGVKWGIGRYLYRLDSPWVPLKDKRLTPAAKNQLETFYRAAIGWQGDAPKTRAEAPPEEEEPAPPEAPQGAGFLDPIGFGRFGEMSWRWLVYGGTDTKGKEHGPAEPGGGRWGWLTSMEGSLSDPNATAKDKATLERIVACKNLISRLADERMAAASETH